MILSLQFCSLIVVCLGFNSHFFPDLSANTCFTFRSSHTRHVIHLSITGAIEIINPDAPRQTCKAVPRIKEEVSLFDFIVELFTAHLAWDVKVVTSGVSYFPVPTPHISCIHILNGFNAFCKCVTVEQNQILPLVQLLQGVPAQLPHQEDPAPKDLMLVFLILVLIPTSGNDTLTQHEPRTKEHLESVNLIQISHNI